MGGFDQDFKLSLPTRWYSYHAARLLVSLRRSREEDLTGHDISRTNSMCVKICNRIVKMKYWYKIKVQSV